MAISYDLIRGHTDAIILTRLMHEDSYGYQINKDIMELTDDKFEIKEATLYTAFRRLEQKGHISPYWGDENVGARRRYYSITDEGRAAHEQAVKDWERTKELIDKLIKETGDI